jgi:hypothetical protein
MSLTLKTRPVENVSALNILHQDAICELIRACSKFPQFADRFSSICLDTHQEGLILLRAFNDRDAGARATADSIVCEEYYEFAEKVMLGDFAGARKELVQTIAMLYRTYIHLEAYVSPLSASAPLRDDSPSSQPHNPEPSQP